MNTDMRGILAVLFLLTIFSINCFAAIPVEQKSLNIYEISPVAPDTPIDNNFVASVIPTDIQNGASNGTVGKKVLDKAIKSALKSNVVKSSSVAQTADALKDGINTEMAIGGVPSDPSAIQHKLKLKVDPVQTRAKLQYSGYTNCSASYEKGDTKFEITENFEAYQLNLSHTNNTTEDLSMVQVQWNW